MIPKDKGNATNGVGFYLNLKSFSLKKGAENGRAETTKVTYIIIYLSPEKEAYLLLTSEPRERACGRTCARAPKFVISQRFTIFVTCGE